MTTVFNTALGGLYRNTRGVETVAHNVANVNTDGYRAVRYNSATDTVEVIGGDAPAPAGGEHPDELPPSNVDLAREFVKLRQYAVGYRANVAVIRVADRMVGALLDIFA
jgi:flagellar basal-body rod protein FlgC